MLEYPEKLLKIKAPQFPISIDPDMYLKKHDLEMLSGDIVEKKIV
jgi:hypothetical protein